MLNMSLSGNESEMVVKLIEIIGKQNSQIQEMKTDLEHLKKATQPIGLLKDQSIKTSRRKLLRGITASAAGLTAVGIALQPKTIQAGGGIYATSTNGYGVQGESVNSTGVLGYSTNGSGVVGNASATAGTGVAGQHSSNGTGTSGYSPNGTGVQGTSDNNNGVQGNSNSGTASGVYGLNTAVAGGYGVAGTSSNGIGVRGYGYNNTGLGGFFSGVLAPIQLDPTNASGAPATNIHHKGEIVIDSNGVFWTCTQDGSANSPGTFKRLNSMLPSIGNGVPASGSHERGEFYIDNSGALYYCTVDGTPGTWHSISGSVGTTSTLTLLDVPFRLVDSLIGTNLNPGVGSLTGFGTINGGDRTTVNANTRSFTGVGGSIPANATAITGYLYANAQAQSFTVRPGFGYLTLWKEGTLYPLATQSHGVVSLYYPHNVPTGAAFTVPLSAIGKFSAASDTTTNIIIEVTGYYS